MTRLKITSFVNADEHEKLVGELEEKISLLIYENDDLKKKYNQALLILRKNGDHLVERERGGVG